MCCSVYLTHIFYDLNLIYVDVAYVIHEFHINVFYPNLIYKTVTYVILRWLSSHANVIHEVLRKHTHIYLNLILRGCHIRNPSAAIPVRGYFICEP